MHTTATNDGSGDQGERVRVMQGAPAEPRSKPARQEPRPPEKAQGPRPYSARTSTPHSTGGAEPFAGVSVTVSSRPSRTPRTSFTSARSGPPASALTSNPRSTVLPPTATSKTRLPAGRPSGSTKCSRTVYVPVSPAPPPKGSVSFRSPPPPHPAFHDRTS